MSANQLHMELLRDAAGRGIAPVPGYGAGFWSSVKGWARKAYTFVKPHLNEAGRNLAKDVIGDLNKRILEV